MCIKVLLYKACCHCIKNTEEDDDFLLVESSSQKESLKSIDSLSTKLVLPSLSPSLLPEAYCFEERKQLLQKVSQLSNQIVDDVATPFSIENTALKLALVERNQKALEQTAKAVSKEFTRLSSNTLLALDLNSPMHKKTKLHHASTLDALNLELPKTLSYNAAKQLNPNNTNTIRDLVEPKSFLELNLLGFQSFSSFEQLMSKAFSYLKTPLEYLTLSGSKLTHQSMVSLPRKTRECIKKTLQGVSITLCRCLGTGYSGNVNLVQQGSTYLAVKTIQETSLKPLSVKENQLVLSFFKKEVSLLMSFNHPNIVGIEAVASEGLFLEWAKDGSLADIMQNLTQKEIRKYILDIVEALIYIHEKGYTHKDLKPGNILISRKPMQAKLCDFGLTTLTKGDIHKSGTPYHVAPEIKYHTTESIPPISNKADIWSLGVLMFRMITNDLLPYPSLDREDVYQYCQRISITFLNKPCNEKLVFGFINGNKKIKKLMEERDPTEIIRSLIIRSLHGDPIQRITLQEIKSVLISS